MLAYLEKTGELITGTVGTLAAGAVSVAAQATGTATATATQAGTSLLDAVADPLVRTDEETERARRRNQIIGGVAVGGAAAGLVWWVTRKRGRR